MPLIKHTGTYTITLRLTGEYKSLAEAKAIVDAISNETVDGILSPESEDHVVAIIRDDNDTEVARFVLSDAIQGWIDPAVDGPFED